MSYVHSVKNRLYIAKTKKENASLPVQASTVALNAHIQEVLRALQSLTFMLEYMRILMVQTYPHV